MGASVDEAVKLQRERAPMRAVRSQHLLQRSHGRHAHDEICHVPVALVDDAHALVNRVLLAAE